MILKFDNGNGMPVVVGAPWELAEVIKALNGGSLIVNIVPDTPAQVPTRWMPIEKTPVEVPDEPSAIMGAAVDHMNEHTPNKRGRKPTKLPHSEDGWLVKARQDGLRVTQIVEALHEKGYPDVVKNDVNNRLMKLKWKIQKTRVMTIEPVVTSPEFVPKSKTTSEEADQTIKTMTKMNALPIEIAEVLCRKTNDTWTSQMVVDRLQAMS
jgi:hypothetical protein